METSSYHEEPKIQRVRPVPPRVIEMKVARLQQSTDRPKSPIGTANRANDLGGIASGDWGKSRDPGGPLHAPLNRADMRTSDETSACLVVSLELSIGRARALGIVCWGVMPSGMLWAAGCSELAVKDVREATPRW